MALETAAKPLRVMAQTRRPQRTATISDCKEMQHHGLDAEDFPT